MAFKSLLLVLIVVSLIVKDVSFCHLSDRLIFCCLLGVQLAVQTSI
jgi:hypothetical protein